MNQVLSLDTSIAQRIRTHGFFIVMNALISIVIATRYFAFLPSFPSDALAIVFIVVATFGQMVLLASILGLVSLPLVFLPKRLRQAGQVSVASLAIALLYFDTLVFAQYRFHMNAVVVDLAMSGQVVTFPLMMWVKGLSVIALLFLVQFLILRFLEKRGQYVNKASDEPKQKKFFRRFALVTFISLLMTHGIHIWAAAQAYQPVTMIKRYLPLFYPSTSNRTMAKYGFVNAESIARQQNMKISGKSDFHYPLKPLKTTPIEKPVNIVLILVDSWRADTFNAENTPAMWRYAQQGLRLENHLSTGNATRTGVFGIFYGIPGTYWHSVLANGASPVLMDRLQALEYDLGIFAAAKLNKPEFHQTIFTHIKNLRLGSKGDSPSARDINLTDDWLTWNAARNKQKPAFSFLFYDAPHGYDFPEDYSPRFEPMVDAMNYMDLNNDYDPLPLMNRYKTSVHFVDSQVKRVLEQLEQTGELANTLVIITGDHGQEMNDNKLNFWGHNSNYTDAQIKVPFAVFGPKVNKNSNAWGSNMTNHQDIVPTLARNYLGIENELRDYTLGADLLAEPLTRNWMISSKYSGYAVVTNDYIVEIGAAGSYQLLDKTNRPTTKEKLNYQYLQEVFEDISLFSK